MLKPIDSFPDYFVDELGNVWSQKPPKSSKIRPEHPRKMNKFLRGGDGTIEGGARGCVRLCRHVNGVRQIVNKEVSTLVLETFVSPRPVGMVGRHGANGALDDSLKNLSWGTQKQNIADEVRDETKLFGECHPLAKLNELQVRIIRRSYAFDPKIPLLYFAKMFDVDYSNISCVKRRVTWTRD